MISKKKLSTARLQLHQAVQLLAATGISFLEKQHDDSHTNMTWQSDIQSLVSKSFGSNNEFKLALSFSELKYRFYHENSVAEFVLDGKTEQQAADWLTDIFAEKGMDLTAFTMAKHYQIPDNRQARGAAYMFHDKHTFKMLSDQFEIAHSLLSRIAVKHQNVSAIRCWPHHFDLAMLIIIEQNKNPEHMKSVGLGLSPGDENYDQPYFYVSPWPYPPKEKLKDTDLPVAGFWHSEGFTSAILTAEAYLEYPAATIIDFLTSAVKVCSKLILKND